MEPQRWELYVDETGSFGDRRSDVAVVGVMVRTDVEETRAATLLAGMRRLMGGIPIPWHAAVFRKVSSIPLASRIHRMRAMEWLVAEPSFGVGEALMRRSEEALVKALWDARPALKTDWALDYGRSMNGMAEHLLQTVPEADPWPTPGLLESWSRLLGNAWERQMDSLLDHLSGTREAACRSALDRLWAGRDPAVDDLKALDDEIRASQPPDLNRALNDRIRGLMAAFHRVFRELRGADASPRCLVFLAGESSRNDWCPPPEEDRYLALLKALLGRVSEAAARLSGMDARVGLHVLGRLVHPRGCPGSFELDEPLLSTLVGELVSEVPTATNLEVREVRRYEPGIHPAFVLADFAANRTLPAVQGSLKDAHVQVAEFGGVATSGEPPKSHAVAAGWAWEHRHDRASLEGALATPSPATPAPRRWAVEQALQWAI